MAVDREGNVIAGGDPKGYIYRIAPDGKAFVLYDSGMREVHSVAVGANGTIYAAVLSGRTSIQPVSAPPPTSDRSSGEGNPTVSVTIGAVSAAPQQTVEAGPGAVVVDTPRAQTRQAGSDSAAQSVLLEIVPDGTVNTLWRSRDEMVFSILPRGNRLLFSTGSKGRIYSMETGPRNTTLLVESTEEQTTKLLLAGNRVYAASSNIGKLFTMSDARATSGTYESIVKDTDAISTWGRVSWKSQNPALITMFTRTGNTGVPDKTWSDWTQVTDGASPSTPKARFIQWKAELRADAARAATLGSVTVAYLQQNFQPEVTGIEVLPAGVVLQKVPVQTGAGIVPNDPASLRAAARAGQPAPPRIPPRKLAQKGAQSFQWTATDKNQDSLMYDLFYRGDGERTWRPLKKDIEDNFYTINSDTLPDGTYTVRIVANDLMSNPVDLAQRGEMESQPFTIDNTPPTVTMNQEAVVGTRVRIAIEAADPTSTLNQAEVSIDTGEWRPVFPKDGIIDSKSESFTYFSPELPAGEHVIAFRVYDQNDNVGMNKLVVRIP
jgi:hypothetical protein